MTQAEKDKIIKDLQEKLAEAEKIKVEQPKRWKPNKGEVYAFVDIDNLGANATIATWENDVVDNWNYLMGNVFLSKSEAEEHLKEIEYTARYKNYVEEHSEPLDWEDEDQEKDSAFYDITEEKIDVEDTVRFIDQGTIYASSEQIIWDAINEIGEENFKKYVLGVK